MLLGLWIAIVVTLPNLVDKFANLVWAFRCDPKNQHFRPPMVPPGRLATSRQSVLPPAG